MAASVQRSHRGNRVGMGVPPLQFRQGEASASPGLTRFESFFFSSRRRHARFGCDLSSGVFSSDLAEALREARHHGIGGIGWLADVEPLRHSGIEDSSAVQMYGKAGLVGDLAQGGSLRRAEAGAAFAIVGVLEAEKSGYRLVDIRQADRAAYLIRLKAPVPAVQRSELKAADNR